MKKSYAPILIAILPISLLCVLYRYNFTVSTGEMLSLFLPLIWGILFALGGGVVYLNKQIYNKKNLTDRVLSILVERTKPIALVLIAQTLIFILISMLYPARFFLKDILKSYPDTYPLLVKFVDPVLFSTIFVPAVFSVIVGACCLVISFNKETA